MLAEYRIHNADVHLKQVSRPPCHPTSSVLRILWRCTVAFGSSGCGLVCEQPSFSLPRVACWCEFPPIALLDTACLFFLLSLSQDYEVDDLIDVIEGSRVYIPWCAPPIECARVGTTDTRTASGFAWPSLG